MKKTLIALAALSTLAIACNKAEVIDQAPRQAITFGEAFVDKATKAIDPSYGTNTLIDEFNVWGTVTGNTNNAMNLYNGATVTRGDAAYGSAFNCEQTEYWIPSASYKFVAIANATSVTPTTGMPTAINYTADGTTDLLFTKTGVDVTTDASATPTGVNDNGCVAFTFNHLLSMVYFNFENTSGNDKCIFKVEDVKISGQFASGTYTINGSSWGSQTEATTVLTFGNATGATVSTAADDAIAIENSSTVTSHQARLIIPGEQTWTVSFTKKFYYDTDGTLTDSDLMSTEEVSTPLVVDENNAAKAYTFAENNVYVINVELKAGAEITFTIDKENWNDWNDPQTSIDIP